MDYVCWTIGNLKKIKIWSRSNKLIFNQLFCESSILRVDNDKINPRG